MDTPASRARRPEREMAFPIAQVFSVPLEEVFQYPD
jgi:DNA-binding XRE family transcriptional regulator